MAESIPRRKVNRAVAALRRRLPAELPLAGLRIRAVGDRIAVQARDQTWDAESGQGFFLFDVAPADGGIRILETQPAQTAPPPVDAWFEEALALEETDGTAARERYLHIIAADKAHVESYINCGRLLHEAGEWPAAELLYRSGIDACAACATLFFNLGVLLEDRGRSEEAIGAYQQALACEPDHLDSHHNLARLYEASGRMQHALRHFNNYRRLMK